MKGTLRELVIRNRSYRRFRQERSVDRETLRELVELARLSPSSANRQPLRFILSHEKEINERIFPCLAWAGYLKDWEGPSEGERPSAYIVVLVDCEISVGAPWDAGIACQSILLGATEKGLGGCIIASVQKDRLMDALNLSERYQPAFVIALGEPAETVVLEETGQDGDIRYWRDDNSVHHVPKRPLDEIILELDGELDRP
jgi:nitroreductase